MSVSRLALSAAALATATLGLAVGPATAGNPSTGNGAPSGSHYQLNVIGVSKDKVAEMDGNNGSRIFVPLWGKAKINLTEGDFGVLDANGTDADGATFSLPSPDPDGDGVTGYSVYARALGTPGGTSTTTTCATDPTTGRRSARPSRWCSSATPARARSTTSAASCSTSTTTSTGTAPPS